MKRFDNGAALAKEFGLAPEVLKKTFDDYNTSVRTKKDPFGKKVSAILHFNSFSISSFSLFSSSLANGVSTISFT